MFSQQNRFFLVRCFALLLAVNAMLPIAIAAQAEKTDSVLLCTSQGYQWVDISSDEPNAQADISKHCLLCVLNDHGFAVESRVPSDMQHLLLGAEPAIYRQQVISKNLFVDLWPEGRAPPIS